MVAQMEKEGFGACTNTGSCSAACPQEISLKNIVLIHAFLWMGRKAGTNGKPWHHEPLPFQPIAVMECYALL